MTMLELQSLPSGLKNVSHWVRSKDNALCDENGDLISCTDPSKWKSFDETISNIDPQKVDGVGFNGSGQLNEALIKEADKIIAQLGHLKVTKATRAGLTTSLVIAAERRGLKTLMVQPTKRISNDTIARISTKWVDIPGHDQCKMLKEKMDSDPIFAKIPLPLPDCKECFFRGWNCMVAKLESIGDFSTATMTYAKLQSIMLSDSKSSKSIKRRLECVDLVVFDEAHGLSYPNTARVDYHLHIDVPQKFRILKKILRQWDNLLAEHQDKANRIRNEATELGKHEHYSVPIKIKNPLKWSQTKLAWKRLIELTERRKDYSLRDEDVLAIKDIITILSGRVAAISYIHEKGVDKIYVSAGHGRYIGAISQFLTEVASKAKHVYASGTLFESYPGYFDELSGKPVESFVFPDLRNTNSMMHIFPDKWKITSWNRDEQFKRVINRVAEISEEVQHKPIYLLSMNKQYAGMIKEVIQEKGLDNINVDYYRSDQTIGVEHNERICIAVGLAHVPVNTYDSLARGNNREELYESSQQLRLNDVHASTWQSWSRVKDPEGKVPSQVYCIGIRASEISDVVTWGTNRRIERNGKKFKAKVDELLLPPVLHSESISRPSSIRDPVGHCIDRIVDIKDILLSSKNVPKSSILNKEEISTLLEKNVILSIKTIGTEVMAKILHQFFACRFDTYAEQRDGGGYSRVGREFSGDYGLFRKHLDGDLTIAMYNIAQDDTLIWGCFDIDNHDGKRTDCREDCQKIISVLREHEVPFLLEASGSPDSYHIWVFFARTRTYNAYEFMRRIASEADVKCEVFPKQKKISIRGIGSAVKVPLGINRKNGNRSMFLNPDTFESIEELKLPDLVRLREMEPPRRRAKQSNRQLSRYAGMAKAGTLRHCMQECLESGNDLSGSEGHELRVAIATEAYNIGMSEEEAIQLFAYQHDFDYDKSAKAVRYIYSRGYRRYGCEALLDKCRSLVFPYCSTCALAQVLNGEAAA